jgi:hypothetical protein
MKNLFNKLSSVSGFFTEKRFINETPKNETQLNNIVNKANCGEAWNLYCDPKKQGKDLFNKCNTALEQLQKEGPDQQACNLGKKEKGTEALSDKDFKAAHNKIISAIEGRWKEYVQKITDAYDIALKNTVIQAGGKITPSVKEDGGMVAKQVRAEGIPGGDEVMPIIQKGLVDKKGYKAAYEKLVAQYNASETDEIIDSVLQLALPKGFESLMPKDILAVARSSGTVVAGAPRRGGK